MLLIVGSVYDLRFIDWLSFFRSMQRRKLSFFFGITDIVEYQLVGLVTRCMTFRFFIFFSFFLIFGMSGIGIVRGVFTWCGLVLFLSFIVTGFVFMTFTFSNTVCVIAMLCILFGALILIRFMLYVVLRLSRFAL